MLYGLLNLMKLERQNRCSQSGVSADSQNGIGLSARQNRMAAGRVGRMAFHLNDANE